MKYQRATRNPLRALTSEMLPYEVPLPFSTSGLYRFLRHIKFRWDSDTSFTVRKARMSNAARIWLGMIFDGVELSETPSRKGTIRFETDGKNLKRPLRQPYKFRARRNNGKVRELSVPHPQSLLGMADFYDRYRDSILYFTNRSRFSIRFPHRVARLEWRRDSIFERKADRARYSVEQADLEYDQVTSYFAYKRYNNINRFYSSSEFQACERKYPLLIRADISKCFDSVYTHTVGWVANGYKSSKQHRDQTKATFGDIFDRCMQYLNYAETNGIVIGPEFSRIFAEIILQEVDVRVDRDLKALGLEYGRDYEIMRYVDDYFIFLSSAPRAANVEETLSKHLNHFKLHLNEQKQEHLETPLRSEMSVAKRAIKESIRTRTTCEVEEVKLEEAKLYFSSYKAIVDFKSILINTELEHKQLANSYLYELQDRVEKTVVTYRKYVEKVVSHADNRLLHRTLNRLIQYLVAVMDVAIFIYSSAPSASHSLKLSRLIVMSLRELEFHNVGHIDMQLFRGKISRELLAQLFSTREEVSFGAHTLNLLDCLYYVEPEVSGRTLKQILSRRGKEVGSLDAFGVLTLLRCCGKRESTQDLRKALMHRAAEIIQRGVADRGYETERLILLLSLPTDPNATFEELVSATSLTGKEITALQHWEGPNLLFAWNASDDYFERLELKSAQMVY